MLLIDGFVFIKLFTSTLGDASFPFKILISGELFKYLF